MNSRGPTRARCFPVVVAALLLSLLTPAVRPAAAAEAATRPPGFGRHSFIEYQPGDLPIIVCAPHGGRERPKEIPDRTTGVLAMDTHTQELARAVADEFFARTGQRPHLIICRIQRRQLDCNREIVEAAAGNRLAEQAWQEYHSFIETARAVVMAKHGRGFLVDLHGHAHKEQRLELGYLLDAPQLALTDAALRHRNLGATSSLRRLAAAGPATFPELLRGPRSLGGLLEKAGYPCAPSPGNPSPKAPFFRGGYTVERHAAADEHFAGLQIETHFVGVRDTTVSQQNFARALVGAATIFLAEHLKLTLPPAVPPPTSKHQTRSD